ncbi:hypothetical protein HK096_008472, partial [Nowakowskiella sp. JEL0078]
MQIELLTSDCNIPKLSPIRASAEAIIPLLELWKSEIQHLEKTTIRESIDIACENGHLVVLEWWIRSGAELCWSEQAARGASSNGHVAVLDWLLATKYSTNFAGVKDDFNLALPSTLDDEFSGFPMDLASENGHVDVLEWWKKSPLAKSYSNDSFVKASGRGHVNVLDWWMKSGLNFMFNIRALETACSVGRIEVLDWWISSSLLPTNSYSWKPGVLKVATEFGRENVLNWFSKFVDKQSSAIFSWNPLKIALLNYRSWHFTDNCAVMLRILDWWRKSPIFVNWGLIINTASSFGDIEILKWCGTFGLADKKQLTTAIVSESIASASQEGYLLVLEWWKNCGIDFDCPITAFYLASVNRQIPVLDFWKNLNHTIELHWDNRSINSASENGYIDVLDWWKNSNLDLKYNEDAMDYALDFTVLDWWQKSGLNLKWSEKAMNLAILNGNFGILEWWVDSGLELKWSSNSFDFADPKVAFELDSGLRIHLIVKLQQMHM